MTNKVIFMLAFFLDGPESSVCLLESECCFQSLVLLKSVLDSFLNPGAIITGT